MILTIATHTDIYILIQVMEQLKMFIQQLDIVTLTRTGFGEQQQTMDFGRTGNNTIQHLQELVDILIYTRDVILHMVVEML